MSPAQNLCGLTGRWQTPSGPRSAPPRAQRALANACEISRYTKVLEEARRNSICQRETVCYPGIKIGEIIIFFLKSLTGENGQNTDR